MIRLVTRGRFTKDYAKGLLAAPEDREPAVRKLVEGGGGKLVNFYFTTGDSDFLLITETNEAESAIAALLAAAAAGTISDVTTSRAWTGAEFKAVADKASKVASLYSPPGKVVTRLRKRTSGATLRMSALGQKRTLRWQAARADKAAASFDAAIR